MTGLIAPTHRSIRKYYENVATLRAQGVLNEMSVRSPFESLLQETARLKDWTFIAELSGKSGGAVIRPDGTLTEDKHNGIRSDPNRADDPEYIVRLLGQVIHVSLETVRIVKCLPSL